MTSLIDYVSAAEEAEAIAHALRVAAIKTEHPHDLQAATDASGEAKRTRVVACQALRLAQDCGVAINGEEDRVRALPLGGLELGILNADEATMVAAAELEMEMALRHPLSTFLVDWGEFWDAESQVNDWLLEPILARGRAHALYAGAKSGKSYLILAACAALATGRPFLTKPQNAPHDVLYVDYEMTADDLRDRLIEFGYGPLDDLSRLHYALLPSLPGLDTKEGGEALLTAAQAVSAALVIVDTTGRAVEGEEDSNDVIRAYYRHTGQRLKAAGITCMRLDHAGKDVAKGQRGASAKNDDVDVVWKLIRRDGGHTLEATHRRVSWVPERVEVAIATDEDGLTTFKGAERVWLDGTKNLSELMDAAGVPLDMGETTMRKEFPTIVPDAKAAGLKTSAPHIRGALLWRRELAASLWISGLKPSDAGSDAGFSETTDAGADADDENPHETSLTRGLTRADAGNPPMTDAARHLKGDADAAGPASSNQIDPPKAHPITSVADVL